MSLKKNLIIFTLKKKIGKGGKPIITNKRTLVRILFLKRKNVNLLIKKVDSKKKKKSK